MTQRLVSKTDHSTLCACSEKQHKPCHRRIDKKTNRKAIYSLYQYQTLPTDGPTFRNITVMLTACLSRVTCKLNYTNSDRHSTKQVTACDKE